MTTSSAVRMAGASSGTPRGDHGTAKGGRVTFNGNGTLLCACNCAAGFFSTLPRKECENARVVTRRVTANEQIWSIRFASAGQVKFCAAALAGQP